jgi:hypothetical protein
MILLLPHKTMSKIKRMIKRKALIKGEIRMMGIIKDKKQSHHTQEYIKPFKEITLWIIVLVTSRKGRLLDHMLLIFVNITRLFLLWNLLRWKMNYVIQIGWCPCKKS